MTPEEAALEICLSHNEGTARPCECKAIAAALTAFGAEEFERGREAGLEEAAKLVDVCGYLNGMPYFPSTEKVAADIRALRSGAGEKEKA
jgi:hypothetical protein